MNNTIKNVAIFGAGAALGSLVTMKVLQEKYAQIAQEEIDSVKEVFRRRADEEVETDISEMTEEEYDALCSEMRAKNNSEICGAMVEGTKKGISDEEPVGLKHPSVNFVKESLGDIANRVKYDQIIKKKIEEPDPAEEVPEEDTEMSAQHKNIFERSETAPYVIPFDEFGEFSNRDELTIFYYAEDDTLADEQEEVIPNVSEVIGDEALTSFGDRSNDPDIVYVRNERLAIDYEVIRYHKSYQETVLGIAPAPKQKAKRTTTKKVADVEN